MTAEANLATRIVRQSAVSLDRHRAFIIVCACFMLGSGFASLVYQVSWVRLLGLGLGSTSASISIVVSSFFVGMSLGSYFFERASRAGFGELRAYAALELCIGICGLLLLPVLLNLDYLLSFAPAIGTQPVLKLAVTLVLLIVPTTCMGATFPVMTSLLAGRDARLGQLISQLYSLNTFGAVAGAACSGFLLIPLLGLDGSIYVAVVINLTIGFVALAISMTRAAPVAAVRETIAPPQSENATALSESANSLPRRTGRWNLPAALTLAVTGFASIAVQVGWTKYLAVFVGSTISGLSIILSVFLAGIAIGAWLIRRRIDTMRSPEALLVAGLLAAGLALLMTRAGLSLVPELQRMLNTTGLTRGSSETIRYVTLVVLIMPPTLIFGALFPLNLKIFCGDAAGVKSLVGKAYAVNTMASILGAAFAGFVAIPFFGTDTLLLAMALLVAATALVWTGYAAVLSRKPLLASLAALVAAGAVLLPGLDYRHLIATVGYDYYSRTGADPDFLFLKEGKAGVIGLITYDGDKVKLQNNGLNEAQLTQSDPNDVPVIEALLAFIPYGLHPNPHSAFVVGFGGGTTTRTLADTDLTDIRVVELEPAIVEAGHFIKGGPVSALSDPRVHLSFNDARNVLVVEDRKYDLIMSQPSHPWLAGTAGVFSREFWEITKSRLNEGGIFAQWVNLFRMDAPTLKSLLKAFYSVYPEGMVFADSSNIIMVGSAQKLTFDYKRFNTLLSEPVFKAKFSSSSVRDVNDVLWYFSLSRDEAVYASEDAVPSLDTNVLAEVQLSRLTEAPQGEDSPQAFLRRFGWMDVGSYVGDQVESKLALLSMYFLRESAYDKADLAIGQVASLNPQVGRTLSHRRALDMLDYATASDIYRKYAAWPSEAHLAQARAMMEIGAYDDARTALALASPSDERRTEMERLAFLTQPARAQEIPNGGIWSLLAKASAGDAMAEQDVVTAADATLPDGALYYVELARLRHYAAAVGKDQDMQDASAAVADEASRLATRLATIAKTALDAGNPRIAGIAARRIEQLGQQPEGFAELKTRLEQMAG